MDLIPEYGQGLESSAVYTVHPFFVESIHGHSNRSLPRLPLHLQAEDIIPTFSTSHISSGICVPKALTLRQLQLYEMFDVLLIVRFNKRVGIGGIDNFWLLTDAFPYKMARGIPLNEGVLYPQKSNVRSPPPHLLRTILRLQRPVNM
jgi:hypothetical protein